MSSENISREVALRIGLAARALPDIEATQLMPVLVKALGMPVSEEKLTRITVRELQEAADDLLSETPLPAIKLALDYLWGKVNVEVSDEALPVVQDYADDEMPGSIRIGIASNNGEQLDGRRTQHLVPFHHTVPYLIRAWIITFLFPLQTPCLYPQS